MILLRHTAIYLLARALVGATALVGIAAYTRLLSTTEYGTVTLALTGVSLFIMLITAGPRTAMLRDAAVHGNAARATVLWGMILPAGVLCMLAAMAAWRFAPVAWHALLPVLAILLLVLVVHEFQLATLQGKLKPWQYTLMGASKSALATILGIAFVVLGYSIAGVLWGTALGAFAILLINGRRWFVGWRHFDAALWRKMMRFACPLSAAAALNWVTTFSDRWLLAAMSDVETAGLYAAAYDLPFQIMVLCFSVVILAGDPLVMNAYAKGGAEAARPPLRQLGGILIALTLPALVGLVLAGPLLVNLLMGEIYRPTALALLPVLALAFFISGLTTYPAYACKLTARTDLFLMSIAIAATANLVLNVCLIPHYGAMGAALSYLLSCSIRLMVLVIVAKRLFPLPLPQPVIMLAALLGTAMMAAWLWPFYDSTSWIAACYVIPGAVVVYAGTYLLVTYRGGLTLTEALFTRN